jgi:hypothetical protein
MKKILTIISAILIGSTFSLTADEINYTMPAESFIADIPFNTHLVTSEVMLNKAMTVEFDLAEETCINDIGVNTERIVKEITIADPMKKSFPMAEEQAIDDFPFDTSAIVSSFTAGFKRS